MFRKFMLSIMCGGALMAVPCQAGDEMYGPFKPLFLGLNVAAEDVFGPYKPIDSTFEQQSLLYQSDQEMSFQFAGKKEEGALSFFLATDSYLIEDNDLYTEGLNAISPAAGIQFTMDFNL